ncbi:unnamed protein product, partial [Laminaria digitata]
RQGQQQRHAEGRRSSILGRVIWGSDLRRERESRLVAAGCSLSSPRPQGVEPDWHRKLEGNLHQRATRPAGGYGTKQAGRSYAGQTGGSYAGQAGGYYGAGQAGGYGTGQTSGGS